MSYEDFRAIHDILCILWRRRGLFVIKKPAVQFSYSPSELLPFEDLGTIAKVRLSRGFGKV